MDFKIMRKYVVGFGVMALLFWCSANAYIGFMLYRQWQTRDWEQTDGVIQSAEIVRSVDSTADSLRRRYRYRLDVSYEYEVAGQTYASDNWRYGRTIASNTRVGFPRYRRGQSVTVYFNPADPSRASLVHGWSDLDRALFLFVSQMNLPLLLVRLHIGIGRMRTSTEPVKVRQMGTREQVRPPGFTPMSGALLGVTLGAVGSILGGWLVWGTDPQTTTYLLLVTPTLGFTVAMITWVAKWLGAGCITYDIAAGKLRFVAHVDVNERKSFAVSRDEVESVGVVNVVWPFHTIFQLIIRLKSDARQGEQELLVGGWRQMPDAEVVADWLVRRLKVARRDAPERTFHIQNRVDAR